MKTQPLYILLLVALAAIAAACAPAPTKFTCTDKLGCVDIGDREPVHLAYMFVTSGPASALGLDTKYGAELAIEDAGGRVLGKGIRFDGEDDLCTPEGGQIAAEKLAADKTIVAVIGANCSSDVRAAAPVLLAQNGLSMVSPSATAPDLTDPAKHIAGFFRTAANDKVQGAVAAEFVFKQLKVTQAATIHDGSVYAQELASVFVERFEKLGGSITAQEAVNVNDKDMQSMLTHVAATRPDLIYYPILIAEGGDIAAQLRGVPGLEKTIMMSADATFSPDFLQAGGKNTIGMYWSSPNLGAFGSAYAKMLDAYRIKYNLKSPPSPYHAHAYDAMTIVLTALQMPGVVARDASGTWHVGKGALRDAIAATRDLHGVTGTLTCDPNGDCADPKMAIYQATPDDFAKLQMPVTPVWSPGGPDYHP